MSPVLNWKTDSVYPLLKQFVIERTGLIYFNDKDADLYQRLSRRFEAVGVAGCQDYFEILRFGPEAAAEFDRMVIELTIGETYFFRHQEQFEALKTQVIPEILQRNEASRRLRIWCAGCSIGAEPFSLAILLAEDFGLALSGWDVKIIATDINRAFLARAELGTFDEWAFRTTSKELRQRHFTANEKSWTIKPELRKFVEFQYHNLLSSPMPLLKEQWGAVDLIICRNVMIYFDWATVAGIMPHFENALGTGGWLIIGHAEQAHGAKNLVLTQLPGVSLYQKSTEEQALPSLFARSPASSERGVKSIEFICAPPVFVAPVLPETPAAFSAAKEEMKISTVATMGKRPGDLRSEISQLKKLADAGQFEKALALAESLLAVHRNDARPYYYRALILEHVGRKSEVESTLALVVELDPGFVMAHYYLALHYRQNKDVKKAKRSFQKVRALIEPMNDAMILPEGDDLRVADLKSLISSHLEAA